MTEQDDNTLLSAYLDGELPATEADALTERLAREPALMRQLEAMRSVDSETRGLFATLDQTPMPAAVLDLLQPEVSRPASDNVVALPRRGAARFLQMPVALAASVALIAGFLVGELMQAPDAPGQMQFQQAVAQDSALYDLLENQPSGQPTGLGDEIEGRVLLSFEDTAGDYCRQLEIRAPSASTHGIACRRGASWQMEALEFGPASGAGDGFQQASGSPSAVMETALEALIGAGDVLDEGLENALITNSWKKSAE